MIYMIREWVESSTKKELLFFLHFIDNIYPYRYNKYTHMGIYKGGVYEEVY